MADVVQRFVDEQKFAGIVTLIARRGQIVHLHATGLRDRAAGLPMQADAIFRIYSMTKPITSVAAMMLFEEGHFLLNDHRLDDDEPYCAPSLALTQWR